jgi:pimeloyl-ACP methyl ester carboxylesterase
MASSVVIPNSDIVYRRDGVGDHAVVFLHGWIDDLHVWGPVIAELSAPGFETVQVDLAGFGARTQATGPFTFDRFAADLLAVVDAVDKPFVLVGHSMAAPIVELVAAARPERALGLVFLAPIPMAGSRLPDEVIESFRSLAGAEASAIQAMRQQAGPSAPEAELARIAAVAAKARPEVVRETANLWNDGYPTERPSGFSKPVLIITGSDDPIVTSEVVASAVVARFGLAETTVTEIEKSSHWPHIEHPSEVAAQLSRFLAGNLATKTVPRSGYSHVTAPTQFVTANGIRYAYRRFGVENGTPLVFLQHFRGGMDHWDPVVTDGLAANRPVILFDNRGVAGSSGETPDTVEAQADDAATFIRALGLTEVDVLGFSIGGYVAQALTLGHRDLVRRLVLAGTKPRAGDDTDRHPDTNMVSTRHEVLAFEDFQLLFFAPSPTSQAAGERFWERRHQRTVDIDPPTSKQTMLAQVAAIVDWKQAHGVPFADLATITQPTLVVNGKRDIMVPTINSHTLAQYIPNAQLIIYPDSGHGALFQYPDLFATHVARFLDTTVAFT